MTTPLPPLVAAISLVHLNIIIVFRNLLDENHILHPIGLDLEIKHELFPNGVDPLVADEELWLRKVHLRVSISERRWQ